MACLAAAGASSSARALATKVAGTLFSSMIFISRHTPARPPYVPQVIAARSCVPGLSEVVCTENGGPLPSDQFSHRQVITTATRALLGQAKPLAFFEEVFLEIFLAAFFLAFFISILVHGLIGFGGERSVVSLGHVDSGVLHVVVERSDDAPCVVGE